MHGDPLGAAAAPPAVKVEVRKLKRRGSLLGWTGLLRKTVPSKALAQNSSNAAEQQLAILREELKTLETSWASEREILLEQLKRKDETIWSLASQQMGAAADMVGAPTDSMPPTPIRSQISMAAVAEVQREKAEAEAAERAWRASSAELEQADDDENDVELINETDLGKFESELLSFDKDAERHAESQHGQRQNMRRGSVPGDAEAFKSGKESGSWSHTAISQEAALWAKGDASQHMLKGYVLLPNVRAAALFDALLRPSGLRSLLRETLISAEPCGGGRRAVARSSANGEGELWRVVMQPMFSWHRRELFIWRAVERRPQSNTYLMALRNGPVQPAESAAATDASPAKKSGWSSLQRGTKPGLLIGYNGLLVSHVELPDGNFGARLCFAWCCEFPGNATSARKLKTALGHFPKLCRELIGAAQSFAPVDHARRAELVDTTGDGKLDSLAVDTAGDGIVDTMIHLSDLGAKANLPATVTPTPPGHRRKPSAPSAATPVKKSPVLSRRPPPAPPSTGQSTADSRAGDPHAWDDDWDYTTDSRGKQSPRRSVGERRQQRDGFLSTALDALGLGGL